MAEHSILSADALADVLKGQSPIRPPVPMFDPLIDAARDLMQAMQWFRREVSKAQVLCTGMESVVSDMQASNIAVDATKHVEVAVGRLRAQISKVDDYCKKMEKLSTELKTSDMVSSNVRRLSVAAE